MTEEDALDLFSLASYCHRRIDRATPSAILISARFGMTTHA